MKQIIYYSLLIFPILLSGQSSDRNQSQKEAVSLTQEDSKKTLNSNSIAVNFNTKVILAYASKSEQLITDFYTYLAMYNQSVTTDLQMEIDKSVQQMYFSEKVLVEDFITGSNQKITLLKLLQFCKENEFVVSINGIQNTAVNENSFNIKYQLLVTSKSVTKTYNFTQKVYFFPVQKTFGYNKKTVWELKLGEF
jgi:hypothetical protein